MALCEVDLSWQVCAGELSNIVIYRRDGADTDSSDSTAPLPSSGLVCAPHLPPPTQLQQDDTELEDGPPPCVLTIRRRSPPYNITLCAVDILCDARHMEVYSDEGVYLDTSRGVVVGQIDEHRKLYLLQHTLDSPLTKCQLKLLSLQKPRELWLHSVHITVGQDFTSSSLPGLDHTPAPTIDVDRVKELVAEMGREIPDEATGLLHAIEQRQKMHQRSNANMGPLASLLSGLQSSAGSNREAPSFASMMSMMGMMGIGRGTTGGNHEGEHGVDSVKPTPEKTIGCPTSPCSTSNTETSAGECGVLSGSHNSEGALRDGSGDSASAVSSPATSLAAVEERLAHRIHEAESRIVNTFSRQLQQLEEKLGRKMDALLETLSSH